MKALLCLLFGHRLRAVHSTKNGDTLLFTAHCECCGGAVHAVRPKPHQFWICFNSLSTFGMRMQRRIDEAYDAR